VGFYQRWIVPCLIDSAMQNQRLDAYRRQAVEAATGHVLEIGVGSGQNLPLYGSAVDRVYAIDPSLELLRSAGKRGADVRVPVSLLRASAEQLPFANAIFDTIVMTWTLCDTRSDGGAGRDAARSQTGRTAHLCGARLVTGIAGSAVAASGDALLETRQRRLSSRPQNGRLDPSGRFFNCTRSKPAT
jgi:SAM-dependent methyltransferase